jgi:hypothetical protein
MYPPRNERGRILRPARNEQPKGEKNKKDEAPKDFVLRKSFRYETRVSILVTTVAAIAIATAAETATATAAAETTAAATAEAATRALFLGTGLIDRQLTATEINAIHLFCCNLGLIGRAHGDEREAARAAGHLVHGDINIGHATELAEGGAKLVFRGLERQVTDV